MINEIPMSDADWIAIERELCARSLSKYIQRCWKIIEPAQPYVHGWHIDAIAEHLEAVTNGEIIRLAIAVPPGMMKSLMVGVIWPSWEWGPKGLSSYRYLGTSHSERLAVRDNMRARRLIQSEWYQKLWGDKVVLMGDQNAKQKFENTATGFREAMPFTSLTGSRGDRVLADDPMSVDDAKSDAKRTAIIQTFEEALPTRLNNPKTSAIVGIQQRLHVKDVIGIIEAKNLGYEVLMLPMEYDKSRTCVTSIGFKDPRTKTNELLFPERFPREVVDRDKRTMGSYAVASQFQQLPIPRGGGMFKREWFEIVPAVPIGVRWVRGWDLAATDAADNPDAAYTAGVKLGIANDGTIYVGHAVRGQLSSGKVTKLMQNTASQDGHAVPIDIPQDPGQAGKPIWEEEPVLMADGSLCALKNVCVGDLVIGMDGQPHSVTHVHEQGELETLELKTDTGRTIVAAPDHPFLTTEGWVEAGQLTTDDVLALLSRPAIDNTCQRTPEEFRLAGYFIGDGSVGRAAKAGQTGSCDSGFTCVDSVQLDDFKRCVHSLGGGITHRARECQVGAIGIQQWLRDTDIAGHTAYNKRVPAWVFAAHSSLVAEFLGAYFACDGFVSKDGGEVIFYSVSIDLLKDVQHLLLRLGISSTIKAKNGKYLEKRHISYLLRMKAQDDGYRRFANRVPVHHSMKIERLREFSAKSRFRRFDEQYLPDRVVSIEAGGLRTCRCLTVADATSFVVRDIVVHNSQVRAFVQGLMGYTVHYSTESGDKETRAQPFASQAEAGNVKIVQGSWNEAYLDEIETFPAGAFKDQVDATSRAFARLIIKDSNDEFGAPIIINGDGDYV